MSINLELDPSSLPNTNQHGRWLYYRRQHTLNTDKFDVKSNLNHICQILLRRWSMSADYQNVMEKDALVEYINSILRVQGGEEVSKVRLGRILSGALKYEPHYFRYVPTRDEKGNLIKKDLVMYWRTQWPEEVRYGMEVMMADWWYEKIPRNDQQPWQDEMELLDGLSLDEMLEEYYLHRNVV